MRPPGVSVERHLNGFDLNGNRGFAFDGFVNLDWASVVDGERREHRIGL